MKQDFWTYQKPLSMTGFGGGATSLSYAGASSSIVTDGLVHWFDFSDTNSYGSGTALTDLSDAGNNMTFVNAPTVINSSFGSGGRHIEIQSSGSGGDKYAYYGTNYSDTLTGTQGTNPFAIEMWVNLKNISAETAVFGDMISTIKFNPVAVRYKRFEIFVYQNRLKTLGMSGSTNVSYFPSDLVTVGNKNYADGTYAGWEHIVATREDTNTNGMKYYRNGSLVVQDNNSINYNGPDTAEGYGLSQAFYRLGYVFGTCKFAIFRRYINGSLTAADVQKHYDLDKARFGLS
tara:strand:- start:1619 stop:2485 length:867 start_codon:yes stop_codon:yes gene_type:complete